MSQTPEEIQQNFKDLDYTQAKRRQFVDGAFDKAVADKDPEMISLGLKTLDGMDKQSLGKLKINEKEKENQNKADESEAMAKFLVALSNKRNNGGTGTHPVLEAPPSRKLPSENRPAYDSSIREAVASSENNTDFTARMEEGKEKA